MTVAQKLCPRDLREGKKSKTHSAAIKFNKICFSRREGVTPSWWCHAHFQGFKLKLKSRAFCWCIVCLCTSNGFFRKLKKARVFFFFEISSFLGSRGNNLFQKSYVIFRVGHDKWLHLLTRWVVGVKKGQKYAYVVSTGCKSQFRKIFEFKIWKNPMLVLKQTIH